MPGCDADRSFLVNVVLKDNGTTGVQVTVERCAVLWPFLLDLSLIWQLQVRQGARLAVHRREGTRLAVQGLPAR